MAVLPEDGVLLAHYLADEVPPAALPLALNGNNPLGGDNPRPLLSLPRMPTLGRSKHSVLGDDLCSLLAH